MGAVPAKKFADRYSCDSLSCYDVRNSFLKIFRHCRYTK